MKSKSIIVLIAVLAVIAIAVSLIFNRDLFGKEETTGPLSTVQTTASTTRTSTTTQMTSEATQTTTRTATTTTGAYNEVTVTAPNKGDVFLTVVNSTYSLPSGYSPVLKSIKNSNYKLEKTAATHYNAMYDAAKADGITFSVLSGYRSYEKQKELFENKVKEYRNQGYSDQKAKELAATYVMIPGKSDHNLGFAVDLTSLSPSFAQTKQYQWLQKNAVHYGFILRYPKDKQSITGVNFEPWHWRFVGVENAKKIKAAGQCLEEYMGVA